MSEKKECKHENTKFVCADCGIDLSEEELKRERRQIVEYYDKKFHEFLSKEGYI